MKTDVNSLGMDECLDHLHSIDGFSKVAVDCVTEMFGERIIAQADKFIADARSTDVAKTLLGRANQLVQQAVAVWQDQGSGMMYDDKGKVDKDFEALQAAAEKNDTLKKQFVWMSELRKHAQLTEFLDGEWNTAPTREAKRLTSEWVKKVAGLRRSHNILEGYLRLGKDKFEDMMVLDGSGDKMTVSPFPPGEKVPGFRITEENFDKGRQLLDMMWQGWRDDLKTLCQSLESWCPSPVQRLLDADAPELLCPTFMKNMVGNPDYPKMTIVANMIDGTLTCSKDLMADKLGSPLFDANDVKLAGKVRDLGYDTVSLTFTLYMISTKLPSMVSNTDRMKEIVDLKGKLTLKGFKLSPSLEGRLNALIKSHIVAPPAVPPST